MKKVMMILSALFIGMSAMAQGWDIYTQPKDEMRGRMTEEKVLFYNNEDLILCFYPEHKTIGLSVTEGIFNYYGSYDNKQVDIAIGFYDRENNFCSKKELSFIVGDAGDAAVLVLQPSVYDTILYWLKNEGGIRLIIPRFCRTDLDVIIPRIR